MKKQNITIACLLLMVICFMAGKNADAKTLFGDFLKDKGIEPEISASIDYYNKYVWRGFLLDGDPVIQPAVTLSVAGFEGGFWGSFNLEDDDSLSGDEVDGWVGYGFDLGFLNEDLSFVSLSFGHTWYGFPEGDTGLADGSQSREFYAGISFDTFLSPYFTWYNDYGDESKGGADGNYYMFGIGHSLDVIKDYGVTLDLSVELGLNDGAFINEQGGYSLSKASLAIPLSDKVTMSPVIAYSSPFDDIADANNDEFYSGVSVSFAM